jgi:putative FmdB family regulatory protein
MPIFEYRCRACQREFEQLVLPSRAQPACPACGNGDLERLLSLFAVDSAETRQIHRNQGRKRASKDLTEQKHAEMEAVTHHHREHEH